MQRPTSAILGRMFDLADGITIDETRLTLTPVA